MDQELKELVFDIIDKTAASKISRVSVRNGDFSITVENGMCTPAAVPMQSTNDSQAEPSVDEENGTVVASPLVGIFYAAGGPDQKPFVSIGDRVTKGQQLCIVEAMKTMNSIESPCDGIVRKIMVQNGSLVEYHQPLIVLD